MSHGDAFESLQVGSKFPGQRVASADDAILGDRDDGMKWRSAHGFSVVSLWSLCQPSPLPFKAIFVYIDKQWSAFGRLGVLKIAPGGGVYVKSLLSRRFVRYCRYVAYNRVFAGCLVSNTRFTREQYKAFIRWSCCTAAGRGYSE